MKAKVLTMVAVLALIATIAAQCAAPATPERIVETVVVEKEKVVTKEVEKQVVVTQEVEKEVVVTQEVEVEVVVTPTPEAKPFEGIEVNVLTFTGPQIAEPLQRRGPDFTELTGAKINVIIVPFNELYQKLLTDMATGTNSFDAFVFAPQWMVDYITPGYLEDLTDRIANDPAIEWEDVAPFFRDFSATYGGRIYTIPLDGDFHMGYYRSDLLEAEGLEPPKTWDEYLQVAATFHGKDLNGDGDPDYGSCISKKRGAQAYWFITDFAASMIQSQGTSQGTFFNPETMEPLVQNAAFQKALELYNETTQYGPPDELNLDVGDTRSLFTSGRCALSLDWGDIGTLAIDPTTSTVQDKTGAMILPGSTEVLDWETGELVPCDETTCPYAIEGVNYAPFASYGGWSGGLNAAADPEVKDAAYAFFSYMTQPAQSNVDVTIGRTGFNPYRTSQFLNRQQWVEAGMSPQGASDYLGAIEASLASPNMVLDLRVPQNQRYQQVVLDQTVSQYLAGEITVDQAMQQIYDGWEEITDELGRDEQGAAYRGSLGITK
jgi:multiple sugar transport system substrate-binding protein